MTGNAINAKSEALEQHELSSEELDAVSGGTKVQENQEQLKALETFGKALQKAGQIAALLPRKTPEVPAADVVRGRAPKCFDAPAQVRAAPRPEAIAPGSAPQEAQHQCSWLTVFLAALSGVA